MMFRPKRKVIKMLHWLRIRGWFKYESNECEVEGFLPLKIKRILLRNFEKLNIENTQFWPKEALDFHKMFQPVQQFINERLKINSKIKELDDKARELEKELLANFNKEGGNKKNEDR